MRKILSIFLVILPLLSMAQIGPSTWQELYGPIHADSSIFVAWATNCVAEPGPMNIANPSAGLAGNGWPASNAVGVPEGTYGVTCLGDGGRATVTFRSPICNGPGPDFAVFENGFANAGNPDMLFLELAFVEVSSDGEHFFRFPAYFDGPQEPQLGGMACMDPNLIHNLASKYAAFYGTPFDLDEIEDDPLLDKNHVTHVRMVDVVGCIQPEYATYDCQGHVINDPWPTPFASSGFDLDAVGVIHDLAHYDVIEEQEPTRVVLYPNPVQQTLSVKAEGAFSVTVYSLSGQQVLYSESSRIDVSTLRQGMYLVRIVCDDQVFVNKIFKE